MELKHIDIANLAVSAINMRGAKKAPDLTNILPSVRARGVLVPLIVRANGAAETYEIIAGKRRYHAALVVAQETGSSDPLPCAVMEAGDDVAALEASLIENIARLDPDEVTRWETFTRLVREGRSPEDISTTFGLTPLQIKRTLALGNLLPRIRNLYRSGQIDATSVRHLTLASKTRQKEWLALVDGKDSHAPIGHRLKEWLLGGSSIPTGAALFDLETYAGEIISDLFGEESFFANPDQFWLAQRAAVEARAQAYREEGWRDVVILEPGAYFHSWEHERRAKKKGGRVYVSIDHRGGIAFHEGYVTTKEARRLEKGEAIDRPARPELSAPLADYVDLHRHSVVAARVAEAPGIALRLVLAHAICGSALWRVDRQIWANRSEAISQSVERCRSQASLDLARREALAILKVDEERAHVTRHVDGREIVPLMVRLLALSDEEVLAILAVVMAETLQSGTELVEMLGSHLEVDMAQWWEADETMLDLIRDKEVLGAVLADVVGADVAASNAKATGKVRRGIIFNSVHGAMGWDKRSGWVPRWMQFPPSGYTARGGVATVERWEMVEALLGPRSKDETPPWEDSLTDGEADETHPFPKGEND